MELHSAGPALGGGGGVAETSSKKLSVACTNNEIYIILSTIELLKFERAFAIL